MVEFPIPLSSLYSLLHGVTRELGSSRIIRFGPHDHLSFVKKNQVKYPFSSEWMTYRKSVTLSPHYFATRRERSARLYVAVDLWYRRSHLQEVMQFEEVAEDDYNLLVHVKRDGRVLLHRKWYALSAYNIHNLSYLGK